MTRNDFWTIVESVNWAALTLKSDERRSHGERSYDLGQVALLSALPTIEDRNEFETHYQVVRDGLGQVFKAYVGQDREARTTDLGEDGFGDLLAHIVGLGRKEYERHLNHLKLITARGRQFLFVESFAYCIPWDEDYDPTDLKLAREVSGLLHWQAVLARNPEDRTANSEVEWRGKACDVLRELLLAEGGTEWTNDEYEAHLVAEREASDAAFEAACAKSEAKEAAKAKLLADFENDWV